jgi:hypothetical protein
MASPTLLASEESQLARSSDRRRPGIGGENVQQPMDYAAAATRSRGRRRNGRREIRRLLVDLDLLTWKEPRRLLAYLADAVEVAQRGQPVHVGARSLWTPSKSPAVGASASTARNVRATSRSSVALASI